MIIAVFKNMFWKCMAVLGVLRLYDILSGPKLTVLGYHSVSNEKNAWELKHELYQHISVPAPVFERQMCYLLAHGYTMLRLRDLAAIREGKQKLPRHAALVYFDDGYRDNFLNAYPILKCLGIPAVLFPVVDFCDKKSLPWDSNNASPEIYNAAISWDEMRTMKDMFEFGTHTLSHRKLVNLAPEEVRREMEESRRTIADRLAVDVTALSYPKSRYNETVRTIAKELGFDFILSHGRGFNYGPDYTFLRKIPIGPYDSFIMFRAKLGPYYPLLNLARYFIRGRQTANI